MARSAVWYDAFADVKIYCMLSYDGEFGNAGSDGGAPLPRSGCKEFT